MDVDDIDEDGLAVEDDVANSLKLRITQNLETLKNSFKNKLYLINFIFGGC
jgi:hypothetical protein